jgi:hypothetical protein
MRSTSRILSTTLTISVTASLLFAGASLCRAEGEFPTPPPVQRMEGEFPTPPPNQRVEGEFPTPPPAARGEGEFPTPPPTHAVAIAG